MSTREIDLAMPLIDEVVAWVESGTMLLGSTLEQTPAYEFEDGVIPLRIGTALDWNIAIDISNEESTYVTLIEVTSDIERAYGTIHRYGQLQFQECVSNKVEKVCQAIVRNSRVESLALLLRRLDPHAKGTQDETIDQLWSTLQTHLAAVIYARAVSLSMRDVQTESVFHACKLGLLPYGWDWESLWCLNPREYL